MKYLIYAVFLYLAIAINVGVFPTIAIYGAVPQILTIVCLLLSVTVDDVSIVLFSALVGGLFWEMYTSVFPGTYMVGFAASSLILFFLSRRVFFVQDRIKYFPVFLLAFYVVLSSWFIFANHFLAGWFLHLRLLGSLSVYLETVSISFFYSLLLLYPMYFITVQVDNLSDYFERQKKGV